MPLVKKSSPLGVLYWLSVVILVAGREEENNKKKNCMLFFLVYLIKYMENKHK